MQRPNLRKQCNPSLGVSVAVPCDLVASCTRGRLAMAPRWRQCPASADLACRLGATDRSGCRGTSVAAALPPKKPHAWMVDDVLAWDVRHRRCRKTYLESAELQEMHSASSKNRPNLRRTRGSQHQSQELQRKRRQSGLLEPCPLTKRRSAAAAEAAASPVFDVATVAVAETACLHAETKAGSAMAGMLKAL